VEFPAEEFKGEESRFCVPLCVDLAQCLKINPKFETCEQPQWKGNPLYETAPDKTCQAPSAAGRDPVDPTACDWKDKVTDNPEQKAMCIAYCEQYLYVCKEITAEQQACCGWGCYQAMLPGGKIDPDYEKDIRCYLDNFEAFYRTGQVCQKPKEACGDPPPIP
jgi:hypothetical protein